MKIMIKYLYKLVTLLLLISISSCGGGGGGGGGIPNPTDPGTGGGGATSNITITPSTGLSKGGSFVISIVIDQATDLNQADVELTYDESKVEINSTTAADVIPGVLSDTPFLSQGSLASPPNLLMTYTLTIGTIASWTGTNGDICTLNFNVLPTAAGTSASIGIKVKYTFWNTATLPSTATTTTINTARTVFYN